MTRTHDELYLQENRYEDTKESFKFTLKTARQHQLREDGVICDMGCAAGEFLYYLSKELPSSSLKGVDILPSLIDKARQNVPEANYTLGDVTDPSTLGLETVDATFLIGVHSIFDDPLVVFDNLINWTKPGGLVIIFGLFNRYPVDVFIQVRTQKNPPNHREAGWNVISQATVSSHLEAHPRVSGFQFHEFTIGVDLPPHRDDTLRSWTFKDESDRRQIMNGIGLIHDFHVLAISVKA